MTDECNDNELDEMTLNEAIEYYNELMKQEVGLYLLCPWSDNQMCNGLNNCKSLENRKYRGCIKRAKEYEQLVTWLKDYRNLRNPDDAHTEPTSALTKVLAETLDGLSDEVILEGLHEAYKYAMNNSGDIDISAEPHEKSGGY